MTIILKVFQFFPEKVMNKYKFISLILAASCIFIAGCKKEAGVTGKKIITGTVFYANGATGTNDPAVNAIVYIAYGTKVDSGSYDQNLLTDTEGKYSIKGLQKGDYYLTADYTDSHGFKYTTPGYGVTIKDKNGELQLDITLH